MNRSCWRAFALALSILAFSVPARAVINPCEGVVDGAPCSGGCNVGGRCLGGQCLGGTALEDGTRCASGDPCSADDSCVAGVCQPGAIVTLCPTSRCGEAPVCRRDVGCVYTIVCPDPSDAGEPDAGADDGGVVEPDAGETDAGFVEDGGLVEPDAGGPDAGLDGGIDAGETVDGGLVGLDGGPDGYDWSDLQGGGCGSLGVPLTVFALAGVVLARRRRGSN